jgi:pSer/pThr/pTyr-binding forkhead associated (FHA) protein
MAGIAFLLRLCRKGAAQNSRRTPEEEVMLAEEIIGAPAAPVATGESSSQAARRTQQSLQMRSAGLALVVTTGEAPGLYAPIGDAPVVVGRGVGVDLQISDPTVSRHHCVIWRAAGRCWIRDLGSMNHTRVNNHSARLAELFEGDVVVVGQTALTLAPNAFARVASHSARTR